MDTMAADTKAVETQPAGPQDIARSREERIKLEARYMQGPKEPVTSSVLISNSKFLNSALYREAYTQAGLRRIGHDLPFTYHIPWMMRAMTDVTDYAEVFALIEAEKAKYPEFSAWCAERKLTRYVASEMGHYADGTLGEAIRTFLQRPGFEMEFVAKDVQPSNDLEYYGKRVGANHDIEHLVTGFGPNPAGEEALGLLNVAANARFFSPDLAQFLSGSGVFVTTAGYSRVALHYQGALPLYMEAMQQGIAAGLAVKKPMMMVRWEDYLDWQLDDIAGDLGFKRGPGAAWDCTAEATIG
jgi:ubiquinone biosynthesis protein COQ4